MSGKSSLEVSGPVVCGVSTHGKKVELEGRYRVVRSESGVRERVRSPKKTHRPTLLGVAVHWDEDEVSEDEE